MKAISSRTTIAVLVCILVFAAAGGRAPTVSCTPDSCCHIAQGPMAAHHGTDHVKPLAAGCNPMGAATCCDFKATRIKTELALSPRPRISTNQPATLLTPAIHSLPAPQLFAFNTAIGDAQRPRASLVPIYLLTLSILC